MATLFGDMERIPYPGPPISVFYWKGNPAAGSAVHHTTGKIAGGGAQRGQIGDGLSPDPWAIRETGVHSRPAVLGVSGPWPAPRRRDGLCRDFAGQPDYRLVHALFVDNADLALVLFDASDLREPVHGVGFWLKQLQAAKTNCPIVLVAAQTDRGSCSLTPEAEELNAFCQKIKNTAFARPIATSASTGLGRHEVSDPLGGEGRDGHHHEFQADQGL
jgi:GTPase SAR1 family protein